MIDDVPILQASGLLRSFGEAPVVNNVSLELDRQQVTLLMGPSGSGKSTLLAILSGLLRPDQGQVMALGHDLWKMSPIEQEKFRQQYCGFIFQGHNLFPALTALQQLEIVLRWGKGESARQARLKAEEMLMQLDLWEKRHLRPLQLSGGEKQRVAIGRALIKDPVLCFADEPTSALDWENGEKVVQRLCAMASDQGATVLMVSHDHRLHRFVDRVVYMEKGTLVDKTGDGICPVCKQPFAAEDPPRRGVLVQPTLTRN